MPDDSTTTDETDAVVPIPFAAATVRAITERTGVSEHSLIDGLQTVQTIAERHYGVDGLVYEWRRQGDDPLVHRTRSSWELLVGPDVWRDFADRGDLSEERLRAVMAVHDRELRRRARRRGDPVGMGEPMVLARDR